MSSRNGSAKTTTLVSVTILLAIFLLRTSVARLNLQAAAAQQSQSAPTYSSPAAMALDPSQSIIYVADETGSQLFQLDAGTNRVSRTMPVGARPTGILVSTAGDRLYVTTETPDD